MLLFYHFLARSNWIYDVATIMKAFSPFAWPIVVLIVIVLFKAYLVALIGRIEKGKIAALFRLCPARGKGPACRAGGVR